MLKRAPHFLVLIAGLFIALIIDPTLSARGGPFNDSEVDCFNRTTLSGRRPSSDSVATSENLASEKTSTLFQEIAKIKWDYGNQNCQSFEGERIQIMPLDKDSYILRQSLCSHFEAPFMYLLFGKDKVLLQDTGATSDSASNPIREKVDFLIKRRERELGRSLSLIVIHSHSHGDHSAGDVLFYNRPNTTVVGLQKNDVINFFGFKDWPKDVIKFDLGERVIEGLAMPGHQVSSVALYDAKTRALFTGDSLYPGRLYIQNFSQYWESMERLGEYGRTHQVDVILGTHIEMTNKLGVDYSVYDQFRPEEHVLPLLYGDLLKLIEQLRAMAHSPHRQVMDHFIITP